MCFSSISRDKASISLESSSGDSPHPHFDASCIFCQIIQSSPSYALLETEDFILIPDKYPKTPLHLLVLPKKHIPTLQQIQPEDALWIGKMHIAIVEWTKKQNLLGFQWHLNCGKSGGQEIFHIHWHLQSEQAL